MKDQYLESSGLLTPGTRVSYIGYSWPSLRGKHATIIGYKLSQLARSEMYDIEFDLPDNDRPDIRGVLLSSIEAT